MSGMIRDNQQCEASNRRVGAVVLIALTALLLCGRAGAGQEDLSWPRQEVTARPHAYWWWMGSGVDTNNLSKELRRYRDAGMGGVHIIPIYEAKGWESNSIPFLSPRWMEMLDYTVREAGRLGLEVDMTTGSGWCFGGPRVTDAEANALMVNREWHPGAGEAVGQKLDVKGTQALMAFGPGGKREDLLGRIRADGSVDWVAPEAGWTVYAVSQKPSGQKVKRAAPGGSGHMLNLFNPAGVSNYLRWVDEAFGGYTGAKPRAFYHDSYEYKSDWAPDLFARFEKRRGYRLQDHWDVFSSGTPVDEAARIKCDYRETVSQIMAEETVPMWVRWAHARGSLTRDQAHGSPGNWLDIYAAADIPETEMFHTDRDRLISKFASSAAHVAGRPLVAAETGTWIAEHFTETLADMKYLLDDLFLSGVNHVFYHGTCYSPDEAPWPGWLFYASCEMNPRNSIWHDVPALNAYATRCQSVLQAGKPDRGILLYWPIHDLWSEPTGMAKNLTVHARGWFEGQPLGAVAAELWKGGHAFDYVSDRQLAGASAGRDGINLGGGSYRAIVVPPCELMPEGTLAKLVELGRKGNCPVVFVERLPRDVPGNGDLDRRRKEFQKLLKEMSFSDAGGGVRKAGGWLVGPLGAALKRAGVPRETLFDVPGLMSIRRTLPDGSYYFIANRGIGEVTGWLPLAVQAKSAVRMDPLSGTTGVVAARANGQGQTEVWLNLPPGGSVILRTFHKRQAAGAVEERWIAGGEGIELRGMWQVRFLSGGPALPSGYSTEKPGSWGESSDATLRSFAGTALYTLRFDAPKGDAAGRRHRLDLGRVCQSARVRLNGRDLGTLITPPFRLDVEGLRAAGNILEVEVTSTSANRIRDLDQRGVVWQKFHDINFVNLNYKPFNAADWPPADAGLLGPVTLIPLQSVASVPGR